MKEGLAQRATLLAAAFAALLAAVLLSFEVAAAANVLVPLGAFLLMRALT
ncbi:MAG: hypothetical protein R3C27_03915 [Hyphomonadaceae bacterium]